MFSPLKINFSMQNILLILLFLSSPLISIPQSLSSASPGPCQFPAIFNLGDSNSDTGGFSASLGPVVSPYGETFFGMPAGRKSDGRLILDFIANSLGLPFLSAYLDSVGTNFSHGANFATSGSEILPPHTPGFSPFTLDVQLRQFLQFKDRSQLAYTREGVFKELMPKEEYFSQALYAIDIGQNDLSAKTFINKSADEYMPDALELFSKAIKTIYGMGGRYFWIHNTGPLGCLPRVLVKAELKASQLDSVGCGIPYNELAQQFNKMLKETIMQLRRDLPLAVITYVDMYSVKYLLISEAEKHGFEHPLTACCGYGGGEYNVDSKIQCGYTAEFNGTTALLGKSCENPSKSIIWDGIHYTDAANEWLFRQIAGGKFSDPPNSLSMACLKEAKSVLDFGLQYPQKNLY